MFIKSFWAWTIPSNSLDQNNLAHGVYNVAQWRYYILFRFLVWLCNNPQSFKKYIMESNVFLGYPAKGTIGVLSSFGHEKYHYKNNVDLWCLIIKYLNEGIGFLLGFGRVTQYPVICQKICYGA
jgi:hypothetical protein